MRLLDAETHLLGGILPENTTRMEKAQLKLITEENFSQPNLKILWRLLDKYYDDHMGIPSEWVLKAHLEKSKLPDAKQITILEIYKILTSLSVTEHEFTEAIALLKDDEVTRKTEEALVTAREILHGSFYDESGNKSLAGQEESRQFLSEALQSLEVSDSDYAPEGDVADDVDKIWLTYTQKEENPDEVGGIKYGLAELDECTGGVRPGELALIAGMTGHGKSQMLTTLAWNAMRSGKNILMFTTETTREEMEIRVLARHSRLPKFRLPQGLDSHQIMAGTLSASDKDVFREVLTDFRDNSAGKLIMVQMPSNGRVDYVHAKANQYNKQAPLDLILIDSINLLRTTRRYEQPREMLVELLQDFKRFASSFDGGRGVAIVSPWQMSRTAWKEATEAGGVYTLASLSDTAEAERSQPMHSKVLTKDGFKEMRDLKVGETILGSDGRTQTIEEIIPNGLKPIYEVHTNDGAVAECTPGHVWTVKEGRSLRDVTAQEMLEEGGKYQIPVVSLQPRFNAENSVATVFNPMMFGYMLQEKNPAKGYVSLAPHLTFDLTRHLPVPPMYALHNEDTPERPSFVYDEEDLREWNYYPLLKEANLFEGDYSKFRIPNVYQNAHEAVRENVVRSFLEDPKKNKYYAKMPYKFLTHLPYDHPGFGEDLKNLVRSLGWQIGSTPRKIVSVVDTGRVEEAQCIRVSNEDGLYITDGFMLTHNSSSQIITIFKEGDGGQSSRLNIQVLKNRGGKEMSKVSYPFDYRNSYIGDSGDSAPSQTQPSAAHLTQDISNLMGL